MRQELMKAAVLAAPGGFSVTTAPLPVPGPDEVRVRLEGCGICGSNLPPFQGRDWFSYPMEAGAPGHEGWGEIDAIGATVTTLQPGQRVAFLSGHAFAEYDIAKADAIVVLPPSLEKKPFPGEALGCAINVFRRSNIRSGTTVVIVGIGFMGALLTALAAQAGARAIAIARRPFALETAASMGAAHLIPMDDHRKIIAQVQQLTGGNGCDTVIEAAGAQWPLDLAAELTRVRGTLVIAGYHQDGPRQVNMQLWNWRGLDVINAHEREPAIYVAGMREAVDAVASGRLNPAPLYTHTFPLDDINAAFQAMASRTGSFMKGLISYD